jgi:hypothetical protein
MTTTSGDCISRQIPYIVVSRNIKMTDDKPLFVERRKVGGYAVRKGNSERASAVEPTQGEAIKAAKKLDPQKPILVERVRNTKSGGRDKWRKP